ncbi:MAG: hypothetical protein M3Z09_09350 [Acidobacteriota bacterium]|nr:hypothetical protein [Acidobacteriota bacterium]
MTATMTVGAGDRSRRTGSSRSAHLPFDEIVRVELRVIVSQIRSLNQSIAELEKTIPKFLGIIYRTLSTLLEKLNAGR